MKGFMSLSIYESDVKSTLMQIENLPKYSNSCNINTLKV